MSFVLYILCYFKTSYVTVYLMPVLRTQHYVVYFKTSYVTVYHNLSLNFSKSILFQNIVCYCLSMQKQRNWQRLHISKHRMLLFIQSTCRLVNVRSGFQNIVCYCLSQGLPEKRCLYCKFQNIVCYCLSIARTADRNWIGDFKTSYVTVYL